jgi:hypothetical protein
MSVVGTKYYKYIDNELCMYREVENNNGNTKLEIMVDGETYTITEDIKTLTDGYVKLAPDAFLNIFVTDSSDPSCTDVYVCVSKSSSLSNNDTVPDLIIRQNIFSSYNNSLDISAPINMGEGVAKLYNDTGMDYSAFMDFKSIDYSFSMALYIDDTVDSILNVIEHDDESIDTINATLLVIKDKVKCMNVAGCCDTLSELLVNNGFIRMYRAMFNIAQLDSFTVILDEDSYDPDKPIVLNSKQVDRIQKLIRKYIADVKAIKYDKDIDVSRVIFQPHIMISDSTQTIFLVTYDVIGDFPIDDDIAKAMNVK